MAPRGLGVQRRDRARRRTVPRGRTRRAARVPGAASRALSMDRCVRTVDGDGPSELTAQPVAGRGRAGASCSDRGSGRRSRSSSSTGTRGSTGAPLRRPVATTSSARTCARTSTRCAPPPSGTGAEITFTGHAIPGAAIGRRALGAGRTSRRSTAATSSTRFGPRSGTGSSRARASDRRARWWVRPPMCSRDARRWFRGSRDCSESCRRASRSRRSDPDRAPTRCGRPPICSTRTRHGARAPVVARRRGRARARRPRCGGARRLRRHLRPGGARARRRAAAPTARRRRAGRSSATSAS